MKANFRKSIYLMALIMLNAAIAISQTPQSINYQAVARNSSGTLMSNTNVNVRFTIHQGSASGTSVFQETHTTNTNDYGLFSLKIGEGTVVSGSFASIDWGNNAYYLQVELDAGSGYTDMGSNQMVSVPYALHAAEAGNVITYTGGTGISVSGSTITNTAPDKTVNLSGSGATTVSGTYPNFTISSTDNNTTYSAGSGIGISGTTISNTAPDKTVNLTGSGATSVTGTYPNFTISSTDNNTTYAAGTGLTLSGTTFSAQTTSALWNANKLQGRTISSTAPTSGQVLKWNGSSWAPGTDNTGGGGIWSQNGSYAYYNTGGVGIGTSTPARLLDIKSSNSSSYLALHNSVTGTTSLDGMLVGISGSGNNTYIWNYESGNMYLGTNDISRVTISSAGNVGIGNATPAYTLDVAGTAYASGFKTSYTGSYLLGIYKGLWWDSSIGGIAAGSTVSGKKLELFGGSSNAALTVSGTNVGIGTSAPDDALEVHGTTGVLKIVGTSNPMIRLYENATAKSYIQHYNGDLLLATYGADGISLLTNNTNRMFIDASGNVGIGTTSPVNILDIATSNATAYQSFHNSSSGSTGSDGFLVGLGSSTAYLWNYENGSISLGTNNSTRMLIDASGAVGIGTASNSTYALQVSHSLYGLDIMHGTNNWELYTSTSGDLFLYANGTHKGTFNASTGVYSSISDRRLKENISDMGSVLHSVMDLKPVAYNFIGSTKRTSGFLAQELLETFPQYVSHNVDAERDLDVYTVDYAGMSVIAIKAIQEQQKMIEDLQQQINELKSGLNK